MRKITPRSIINYVLDSLGLSIALIIQISVMTISMSLLGYTWYMKAGFIAIGWVVVLFAVRAWIKGSSFKNRLLWALFATTSIFFSWSFALVGTDVQTTAATAEITVENDSVLQAIRGNLKSAREELTRLNNDFDQSGRAGTIDSVLSDRQKTRDRIAEYESLELERINKISSGELTQKAREQAAGITAKSLFYAIPNSADRGRWWELIIFGFIFLGLEITIITAVEEQKAVEPHNEPVSDPKQLDVNSDTVADKLSRNPSESTQGEYLQHINDQNKESLIETYARLRFIEGRKVLATKVQVMRSGLISEDEYQRITNAAFNKRLIALDGLKTVPVGGVTKDSFITAMADYKEQG